jgi:putative membrane protein
MKAGQSDAFEIQSGQLAASKASSPDVRAFGQRMIKDHTKSTQMVLEAAGKSGLPALPPPALRPDQQDKLAQLRAADGAAFDTLYAAQQLQAHQEALDLQSAYARNGDDENLRKAAAKIAPVVTMHLDMLRNGAASGMTH